MSLALEHLVKRYGDVRAVDDVSIEIAHGEFFTLLGPSGCGKTSTLRLIAGFETLDSGAITLDGTDIAGKPPHKRPVNTVFQSYALFPHMTVAENVAFGLRYKRVGKAEVARRVGEAMELVQLGSLAARRPGQLSGGQQQRVALARALVLEPPVLLLDEPLGALDARLRIDLQVELKRIQETLEMTFVYVTHDQDEALTMSDRVAVMKGGRVEQCDEPRVLYEAPGTAFVANFLGSSNLIPAAVTGDGLQVGEFTLRADVNGRTGDALAMIRPERVRLEPHGSAGENRVPGMVEAVVYLGFHQDVRVRLASGALVRCDVPNDGSAVEHASGDPVCVHLPADCLRVLDP
ncbi:ABC transporter ATP-binding protein [Solirubrobacter sp. CPCC 204708]|uniref:Spermidine/putrescine import ATP-binding protein PotA n=1 Tax=Solirubrobacter deserti TaxID=2282478 RepID=A0ABT4RC77_9ACTN|nr:ABC transporter ATP-binding protein [Solirubrobacter deserti]MBE2315495.1 ABC transporter ATP-binding protein [Solirubrobacter deserti]MDA0136134.1 ABC transporter ATP-binding protein [Solirubrobacter deserti]